MTDAELPLDNPMLVQWEFASEERLEKRNALYRRLIEGVNAEDVLFEAVREVSPKRLLDVGCGAGEMAKRIQRRARRRGRGARLVAAHGRPDPRAGGRGGARRHPALPFEDGEFDCVVAGWVLYHVVDREQAIAECARVLRPGGRFVAPTLDDDNLSDLWEFLGSPSDRSLTFSATNGAEQLAPFFAHVEARQAHGVVVFPTPDEMRAYVAANMTRAHLAAQVPDFAEPVRVRTHHTVFVADKA